MLDVRLLTQSILEMQKTVESKRQEIEASTKPPEDPGAAAKAKAAAEAKAVPTTSSHPHLEPPNLQLQLHNSNHQGVQQQPHPMELPPAIQPQLHHQQVDSLTVVASLEYQPKN